MHTQIEDAPHKYKCTITSVTEGAPARRDEGVRGGDGCTAPSSFQSHYVPPTRRGHTTTPKTTSIAPGRSLAAWQRTCTDEVATSPFGASSTIVCSSLPGVSLN